MPPDSLFLDKSIMVIADNFPTSVGRNPLKKFCDRSSSISFWRCHRPIGMVEDNEFRDNLIICSSLRLLTLLGMEPVSLLPSRCNSTRLVSLLISVRMVPDKLLFERLSSWRLFIAVMVVGIFPLKLFPLRDSASRLLRLANVL